MDEIFLKAAPIANGEKLLSQNPLHKCKHLNIIARSFNNKAIVVFNLYFNKNNLHKVTTILLQ